MKTLIIGASGLVGGYLYKAFLPHAEVLGTSFPQSQNFPVLDIRDKESLSKIFTAYKPQAVLCPAAISNVEFCQQHPEQCRPVNIEGIYNVIRESKRYKAKFIFLSSEYVFDGQAGPYTEEDKPLPLNEYGKEKLEVENIIRQELSDYLIVRTTVVYGWEYEGKNFVMQMLKKLKNHVSMRAPADQYSSPTYAADLAGAIEELVSRGLSGMYNVVGASVLNRFEFAKIVCDVFDLDSSLISPVVTSQLNQSALRPLKAGLKIDKLNAVLKKVKMRAPFEGLLAMKEEKDAVIHIN